MLNNIFISDAVAQTSEAATQSSAFSFVPLILIFVIFYFLIIRPQTKKVKEHEALVNNLKIGNKVVTSSGIHGVIRDIDKKEDLVELEIAKDVNIKIIKRNISLVVKPQDKKNSAQDKKNSKKK